MANLFKIIWKEVEPYRGFMVWKCGWGEPLYATRVGMDVKSSLKLEEIHKYVDMYYKARLN